LYFDQKLKKQHPELLGDSLSCLNGSKIKKLKEQNIFDSLKCEVTQNISVLGTFILYEVV
jgi:hypothetical protein